MDIENLIENLKKKYGLTYKVTDRHVCELQYKGMNVAVWYEGEQMEAYGALKAVESCFEIFGVELE